MKNKKIAAILISVLLVLVVALGAVYFFNREKPSAGGKTITIEVVDNLENSKTYKVTTEAEYLRQAMEEAEGLEFSGSESEYGMFVETVNGLTADYNATGAYWSFYVNGTYCNYGIDTQPVADGDAFKIAYEVFVG